MIKTIIFDLGGVCFEIDWLKINDEMIRKFGISTLVKSSGNQKLIDIYNNASEGKVDVSEFFKELSKNKANYEEVMKFYKEKYKECKLPNTKLINLIKKLNVNYKIVCLSDTNRVHYEAHQEQGSLKCFDKVFFSFKLGNRKADKNTFINVLEQLKMKPEEVLFIDDSDKNVSNAKSLGMFVIKYESYDKLIKDLKQLRIV